MMADINASFSEADARAFTMEGIVRAEQSYQRRQTPIRFVFSFGIVIGFIVGLVMVYQVLTTDVQDHLRSMRRSGDRLFVVVLPVGCLRGGAEFGDAWFLSGVDDLARPLSRRRRGDGAPNHHAVDASPHGVRIYFVDVHDLRA
ncbi:MAG: hypothetical protein R3B96_08755 [Pirellulaceae bacterium]